MTYDAQLNIAGTAIDLDLSALATAATYLPSASYKDMGAGLDEWGDAAINNAGLNGGRLYLFLKVGENCTAAAGTNGRLAFALQHSPSTTAASFADTIAAMDATALTTGATTATAGKAGYTLFKQPLPLNLKRYLRLRFTVSGSVFTAGKVNAYIGWGNERDV